MMNEYEIVFTKKLYNKIKDRVYGHVYCGVKDNTLRIDITTRDDLGFTMWVDDFANRILSGLTTDYVLYEFLRKYRAYLVSEITCDYFKKAQALRLGFFFLYFRR